MKKLFLKGKVTSKTTFEIEAGKDEKYAWCSWKTSKKHPFCDSSHKSSKFLSIVFKAPEDIINFNLLDNRGNKTIQ